MSRNGPGMYLSKKKKPLKWTSKQIEARKERLGFKGNICHYCKAKLEDDRTFKICDKCTEEKLGGL